jgi:hypothetical protein
MTLVVWDVWSDLMIKRSAVFCNSYKPILVYTQLYLWCALYNTILCNAMVDRLPTEGEKNDVLLFGVISEIQLHALFL